MNNNDVIRKIRYTFDYNDKKIIDIFALGGMEVTREQICNWLKKDEDTEFVGIYDKQLATFLNGFIVEKRGRKDGPQAIAEKTLTNNIILRKIKIALDLKNQDLMEILDLTDKTISKHELSAFFRKPDQRQYRLCRDQFLRNVLLGIQLKYHNKQ